MIDFDKTLQATQITSVGLVGFIRTDFPQKNGNCFRMETDKDGEYRIVNFNYENLKELLRTAVVTFPIDIVPLGESSAAMIVDGRIPNEWYSNHFCTVCTPREHLPAPQRLFQVLDIKRGKRIEQEIEINGQKSILVTIKC